MAEIITLAGSFSDSKALSDYCNAQYLSIQSSVEKIKKLESEITHLQQLLASTTDLLPRTDKILKTPELAICEVQISILENRALQKELTLEEVKTFDLLVKNKLLLSGQPTTINGQKKNSKIEEYTEAQLVQIAKIEEKKNG